MGISISGLFTRLFGQRSVQIAMLGLDAAGKTTILYNLKLGDVVSTIPTLGFNVETVQYSNIKFTVWDIGGQDRIRALWSYYYCNTQALIFVVDSNDQNRISVARTELWGILNDPQMKAEAVLVLANKQDLPNAMSVAQVTDMLDMALIKDRKWYVQSACAAKGEGIYEGMDWLSNVLA